MCVPRYGRDEQMGVLDFVCRLGLSYYYCVSWSGYQILAILTASRYGFSFCDTCWNGDAWFIFW